MANPVKAGVAHPFIIETNADRMGIATGFVAQKYDSSTGTIVDLPNVFTEILQDVPVATATTTVDANIGDNTLTVDDASAFSAGSSLSINGDFYRIMAISGNLITLKYKLTVPVVSGAVATLVGNTGSYTTNITFTTVGFHTIFVTNIDAGMDNRTANIEVVSANIDDVSGALSDLQGDVTSIKTQIDILDEASVNGVSAQVDALANALGDVSNLINNVSDVRLTFAGDVSAVSAVGVVMTGGTSGAVGTVQYVTHDVATDITAIVLQNITGTFVAGEEVTNESADIVGNILDTVNNVTNSVLEFVEDIRTLLDSEGGLDTLNGLNKNIEHLIKGDALLEDGSVNPTAGKGLTMIFDELIDNSTDSEASRALLEDAGHGLAAIQTTLVSAQAAIEAKVDAISDESNANSVISKINAARAVIDANKGLLENGTYGLEVIKASLDTTAALFEAGGGVELRFTSIDTTLGNLNTTLVNGIASIDGKLDTILAEISNLQQATTYQVLS